MTEQQEKIALKVVEIANFFGIDPAWLLALCETESSMGINNLSPTGAKGPFGMTSIAMKDLHQEMVRKPLIGIACGAAFASVLYDRWETIPRATEHFCNPADRAFYGNRVAAAMDRYKDSLT